jgi:hypothetical protein
MARDKEAAPLEAEKADYRKPKRPTKTRLAQKQFAVVMLAWAPAAYGDEYDSPADRDFEPFDKLEHAQAYFEANIVWAKSDWKTKGDLQHAIFIVDDTSPDSLHFLKMDVIGGNTAWRVAVREGYKLHPEAIFTKTKRERIVEDHKVNKKAAPKKAAAPVKKAIKHVERRVLKPKRDSAAPKRHGAIKPRIKQEAS